MRKIDHKDIKKYCLMLLSFKALLKNALKVSLLLAQIKKTGNAKITTGELQ